MALHSALDQAMKNQLVTLNTSKAVMLPKMGKKEIKPLNLEQVGQLLATIKEDRLYPAILLEFNTGLRRGELLGLRWQDVDLRAGLLQVRQTLARVGTHTGDGPKTRLIFQEPKTPQSRLNAALRGEEAKSPRARKP